MGRKEEPPATAGAGSSFNPELPRSREATTVTAWSQRLRPGRQLLFPDRERSEEGERSRDRDSHVTGSGTRVTASGHARPRDGQSKASPIGATANGRSESASALVGPGSGQDLNRDRQHRTQAEGKCDESQPERFRRRDRERPVEREHDPRDRAQRRSSRESRTLEGDRQEKCEREQVPVLSQPSNTRESWMAGRLHRAPVDPPSNPRVGRLEDSTSQGQRAQGIPVSAMILLPLPPGGRK